MALWVLERHFAKNMLKKFAKCLEGFASFYTFASHETFARPARRYVSHGDSGFKRDSADSNSLHLI